MLFFFADSFFDVAFQGAARMVLQNTHPAQIKDSVCSTSYFNLPFLDDPQLSYVISIR